MKRTKKNLAGQRDIKVANDLNREQEVVYLSSHGDQGPGHRTSNGSQGRAAPGPFGFRFRREQH